MFHKNICVEKYCTCTSNIFNCISDTIDVFKRQLVNVEVRNSIKAEIWTISNNRTTNCQSKMKEREKKILDQNCPYVLEQSFL